MIITIKNKKILLILSCFSLFLMSCITAPETILTNNVIAKEMTMPNTNTQENMTLSSDDELLEVLKTMDYFANNYSYTIEQMQDYFNIEFDIKYDQYMDDIELRPKYENRNISDISIRGESLDSQLLVIELNENMCFNYKQLRQHLEQEGYEIELSNILDLVHFKKVNIDYENRHIMRTSITVKDDTDPDNVCISYYLFDHSTFTITT